LGQLTGESFLLCLAQIGLGFAGFGGLIITLLKEHRSWSHRDMAGIKSMLEHSLGIVLLALMPFLVWYWLHNEQTVWRFSNVLMGAFLGWEFVIKIRRWRRLRKHNLHPRYPGLLIWINLIPMIVVCVLELWASWNGSLFWYGFGLLLLLFQAFVQFWVFVTKYMEGDV
jgi:hypothetical protein